MSPRILVGVGAVAAVAGVAIVPLRVHASGVDDIANHPVVVVPMATAAVVLWLAALSVPGDRGRATRAGLAATGGAMFLYLAVTAGLAWHGGEEGARDGLTEVLVAAQGLAWVPPLTLLTVTFLVAIADVGVAGSSWLRRIVVGLTCYAAVAVLLAFITISPPEDSPYADLAPLWDSPVLAAVATVLLVPWLGSILIAPVAAWRAVPRAPAERRAPLVTVALATLLPPVTIVFCLAVSLLAYALGVLSLDAGASGLSIAFHLPFVLASLAIVHAFRAKVTRLTQQRVATALTITIGTPLLIMAATLAWWLGDGLGAGGPALVIGGTLVLGAAASTVRRRLVRLLMLRIDPARARTAALVAECRSADETNPTAALEHVVRTATRCPTVVIALRVGDDRWVHLDGSPAPTPDRPTTAIAHVDPHTDDAVSVLDEAEALVSRATLALTIRDQDARVSSAAAEERTRLERELHDGVQGRLLALALDLRVAQGLPDGESRLIVADAVDALRDAIDELRALSHGGGPELLSRHGLRAALTDFANRMPMSVSLLRAPARLPPAAESVIYLTVCEAVTNAVKHSRAEAVEVDITAESAFARVVVTDDGVGGADLRAGTGLRGLSERVAAAGGGFVVSDRQPHGTLVEVTVPCGS